MRLATTLVKLGEHTATLPDGRVVDVEKLWELTRGQASSPANLQDFGRPSRSSRTGFSQKRYQRADTSFPVLATETNHLVDGRHRAAKLIDTGHKTVPMVRVSNDQLDQAVIKLAAVPPQEKVDKHFVLPQWDQFNKNLRGKKFVEALKNDSRADAKLKRYTEAMHMHATGKGPTQRVGKYVVKFHPQAERFSCSCRDWRFKRSHSGEDCKHILELKKGMTKLANPLLRSLGLVGGARLRQDQNQSQAFGAKLVADAHKREMQVKHAEIRGLAARRLIGG